MHFSITEHDLYPEWALHFSLQVTATIDLGTSELPSGGMGQLRLSAASILSAAIEALLVAVGAFASCLSCEAVFADYFAAKWKMSDLSSR